MCCNTPFMPFTTTAQPSCRALQRGAGTSGTIPFRRPSAFSRFRTAPPRYRRREHGFAGLLRTCLSTNRATLEAASGDLGCPIVYSVEPEGGGPLFRVSVSQDLQRKEVKRLASIRTSIISACPQAGTWPLRHLTAAMDESAPSPVGTDSAQPSIHQAYDQLRQAIEHDDGPKVRQLLRQFVAIFPHLLRWQDWTMRMPPLVTLAAKNGALRALEALLEHHGSREPFPVHQGDGLTPFLTPLNAACQAAQTSAVRYLLDLNPPWDIEEKDDYENTPLFSALQADSKQAEQSAEIIRWLLTAGADTTAVVMDHETWIRWTPLKLAMCSAGSRVVKWLVEADAQLNCEEMGTLLRVGCEHRNALAVETLLQLGGKTHLTTPDGHGRLPLHSAVHWNPSRATLYPSRQNPASFDLRPAINSIHETLNVLLSDDEVRRATINAKDEEGITTVRLAAHFDALPILRQLLDRGADPSIRGPGSLSLLHDLLSNTLMKYGSRSPFRPDEYEGDIDEELISRLVSPPASHGANAVQTIDSDSRLDLINEPNHSGETPLHLAARAWLERTIGILLRLGANPNARDTIGRSPAHLAAKLNRVREHEDPTAALAKQDRVLRLLTTPQVNDDADLDNAVAGGTVRSILESERANLRRRREWFVKAESLRAGAQRELARIAQLPVERQPEARRRSAWYGVGWGWEAFEPNPDLLRIVGYYIREDRNGVLGRSRGRGRGAASRLADGEVEEIMMRLDRLLERQP